MKTLLIIIFLIIIAFVLKSCFSKNEFHNEKRPDITKPSQPVSNDKIVYISNAKIDDLKKAIQQFCNSYNQEEYRALPLLTILNEDEYVITFPYNIDFETFCYFVNYLHYPNGIIYKPEILAWTSTKTGDLWMTNDIVNKKVLLYIPENDKEYDNVFLTTENNIGYKMGFAMGEEMQKLDKPRMIYENPIELNELIGNAKIEFQ